MSLVEKALELSRKVGARPESGVAPVRTVATPAEHSSSSRPVLQITGPMRAALGLDCPAEQLHQRLSEYRHIKRQVLADRGEVADGRVLVVASALSGEGKSFNAVNLAHVLALEPDFSVLLVDADVVKPHVSRSLDLLGQRGLLDALVDDSIDVEGLIHDTDVPRLSVLPAGRIDNPRAENATEYFASERMQALLARLLMVPRRLIVVDSLPLLQTTEARVLASLASQVLLVVRAESTPQSAVEAALKFIPESVKLNLLLNAMTRTRLSRYLGYGYGFDYEYSYRREK